MKEGLGDILYFLAMIAFFVISSIAKSKKAKKKAMPAPEPAEYHEEEDTDIPDPSTGFPWLDDIFKDEEEIAGSLHEETPVPTPAPEYQTLSQIHYSSSKKNEKPKKRELFKESEIEESDSTGSYWDEEEFDLRKAIIFSEILKRPEL